MVPPGCLVVAGDNPHSQDSRHLGFVSPTAVLGSGDPCAVEQPRDLRVILVSSSSAGLVDDVGGLRRD
ncbi:MAG: S26 family signal peptidase [Actinophytocola sp.]|uniref:S26 family signal peptidase n=1 Tax=Actinophytocola sp. TaxID=1872138 RepID=UPI003D6B8FD0